MRVCVIFCSTIPALKFTFFKEELFGLCPENSGTPRQLRFSYSTENSEEPFFELNSFPAQPFTHFPLAANFAIPQTLLKSFWLGNRPRHDEAACSHSSPATDGSLPRRPPARILCPATTHPFVGLVSSRPTIVPLCLRVSAVSHIGLSGPEGDRIYRIQRREFQSC